MPVVVHGRALPQDRASGQVESDTIEDVWRRYTCERSEPLRDRLVVHYMVTHVRPIAERLHATLPRQVDLDDLVQEGYLGLVDAIDRFDMDRDIRFETFSSRRVYGAMQDYLRDIDPIPRVTRTRSKRIQRIMGRFAAEHGRGPTEAELREITGLPDDEVRRLLEAAAPASFVPFSAARPDGECDDEGDAMCSFNDPGGVSPLSHAEREDLKRWVTQGFSRRDRLIIILYYFERMTMKEVGGVLGCCESRVSQRLESIVDRLRSRLDQAIAEKELGG